MLGCVCCCSCDLRVKCDGIKIANDRGRPAGGTTRIHGTKCFLFYLCE